jgi:hypothetical protein
MRRQNEMLDGRITIDTSAPAPALAPARGAGLGDQRAGVARARHLAPEAEEAAERPAGAAGDAKCCVPGTEEAAERLAGYDDQFPGRTR